jgi:aldehyde dehydrogenase (NAD+)
LGDLSTDDAQDIVNPATGAVSGRLALSTTEDVDCAVAAARRAYASYSQTSFQERAALLNRIADGHTARAQDIAQSSTADIGMPVGYASVIVHASAERQPLVTTAL